MTTATTACGDDWRRENAASVRIPRQGGAPPWCQRSDETEYTLPGVEAVGRSGESRAALGLGRWRKPGPATAQQLVTGGFFWRSPFTANKSCTRDIGSPCALLESRPEPTLSAHGAADAPPVRRRYTTVWDRRVGVGGAPPSGGHMTQTCGGVCPPLRGQARSPIDGSGRQLQVEVS